jgi:hypothetical protein
MERNLPMALIDLQEVSRGCGGSLLFEKAEPQSTVIFLDASILHRSIVFDQRYVTSG